MDLVIKTIQIVGSLPSIQVLYQDHLQLVEVAVFGRGDYGDCIPIIGKWFEEPKNEGLSMLL